jgi:transcriptional regulator of acetoin/glycerol metabolism
MCSVTGLPDQIESWVKENPRQEGGRFEAERPEVAWDWMAQTGLPPDQDNVRPQVSEAWRRCIDDYGLSPRASVLRPRLIADSERVGAAAPAVEFDVRTALATMAVNLQPALKDTSVSLLLADSAGTLIHAMDAGSDLGPIGRRLVRTGESWSERTFGNNGLGTAAVLREPVAFEGSEHFSSVLHPFATVGHPLFAHDGTLIAVLGLISDQRSSAQTLLGFVRIASYLIETNLFEREAPDAFMLRLRLDDCDAGSAGQNYSLDGHLSLDEQGQIVGATRMGLNLLRAERHEDILFQRIETVLGITTDELTFSAARGEQVALELPGGRRLRAELVVKQNPSKNVARTRRNVASKEFEDPAAAAQLCHLCRMVGEEPWRDAVLGGVLEKAANLQKQKISMLITGESGVGKDHLVRRIHAEGPRKDRPLVLVNCAAIPHELISSELFGYAPGSFTGARTGGKTGKFAEAHTGVLFLDEIGDMPIDLQTALLCVLDSSEIVPVGGSKPIAIDVQVIAATNCDLRERVRDGAFRRDLYYRLNGAQFWLPPLRERPDRLGLIEHLWEQEMTAQNIKGRRVLSAEVRDIFEHHPWPGNVRELRNVLRSCLAVTTGPETLVSDLPGDFLREMANPPQGAKYCESGVSSCAKGRAEGKPLADWEADAIRSALANTSGNISESARQLGITRQTLYHKMARLGLQR